MDWKKDLAEFQKKLNSVSPSFCLAKWLQLTLHLQTGFNHSCHHPVPHKIPLDELEADVGALNNTTFKKEQRHLMLEGRRPEECSYCWKIEDAPGTHYSDRIIKSSDPWAISSLEKIAASDWRANINPTYLEVSFGYECNFSCAYCSPDVSSSIWKDFEKNGEYATSTPENNLARLVEMGKRPYLASEHNPYVEAFWKWFPTVVDGLKIFRITGGEPLLNNNTFKMLDFFAQNPAPELELSVNSNLCVSSSQFEWFLEKIGQLIKEKKIKKFMLYTSVDSYGEQAEYIRYGLDYGRLMKNVRKYLDTLEAPMTFMVTMTLLSIPGLKRFLQDVLQLGQKYNRGRPQGKERLTIDMSYVHRPSYLSVEFASHELKQMLQDALSYMQENSCNAIGVCGFTDYEINKLQRICDWLWNLDNQAQEDTIKNQGDFYLFVKDYEHRKKLAFKNVFPELTSFLELCQKRRLVDIVSRAY